MKFFSQNGEDVLLWQVFKEKQNGFFIDVGAFDGIHLSNSYSFELEGWTGICVEPNPLFFSNCKNNRPLSLCLNLACTSPDKCGEVDYYQEPLGLLSGLEAYNTEGIEERYARRNMVFPGFTTVKVTATTLDSILDKNFNNKNVEIDFISIDVEGTEIDVLKGFTSMPRIIVAEVHSAIDEFVISDFLAAKGYKMARKISENIFFSLNDSDMVTLRQASISATTEYTLHPLGKSATLQKQVNKNINLSNQS